MGTILCFALYPMAMFFYWGVRKSIKIADDQDDYKAGQTAEVTWLGAGIEPGFPEPLMGVLVLTSLEPFNARIGFRSNLPWFKWLGLARAVLFYGESRSEPNEMGRGRTEHRITIATYLGCGPADFCFLCSAPGVRAYLYSGTEAAWIASYGRTTVCYHKNWWQVGPLA